MWNDLDRFSKIVATALSFEDLGIDLTGREVVVSSKVEIEEALVIAEVKINFATIVQNEDFTVLKRTHGSSIAVQIGVNFDRRNSQSGTLQENADATCSNTFAQSTEHAPADNYVPQAYQRDF